MPKARKKPVVIDFEIFDGTPEGANAVFDKFNIPGARFVPSSDMTRGVLMIPTLEGEMEAGAGARIIKGTKGEFYPCKADIWPTIYEEVEESTTTYCECGGVDDQCRACCGLGVISEE